ncbi:predicted protein [Sparassis crispa]|uniref:Ribosomal protein S2 n=1 Tax=Sparassis crispa TaxID=139825 RepID=A0A401GJR8_9APHY|nr:predicted protein [Sparassis crispa]GBE82411.1 predicted protein [Sparassis crispa]
MIEEKPLETVDDWTNFQLKRAEYQSLIDHLSEYGSTQTRDNAFQPHHSLHRPPSPSGVTLSALLASGITIIDLDHTLPLLRRAANVVRGVAAKGGSVVFLGTRPDLRPVVRAAVERMGSQSYHVGEKWLPGTLTNKLVVFGADVRMCD